MKFMMMVNIVSIVIAIVIIFLIVLFFVSLFSFIKRNTTNSSVQSQYIKGVDAKLDKIIALLEEQNQKKEQ